MIKNYLNFNDKSIPLLDLILRGNLRCLLQCMMMLNFSNFFSPKARQLIAEQHCAEDLLRIIKDYDSLSKK